MCLIHQNGLLAQDGKVLAQGSKIRRPPRIEENYLGGKKYTQKK
jgi:hypothetical protein